MLEIVSRCCRPSSNQWSVQHSGRGSSCAEGRSEHSISVRMIVGGSLEMNLSDFCSLLVVSESCERLLDVFPSHVMSLQVLSIVIINHIFAERGFPSALNINSHFGGENISSKGGRIKSSQVISPYCQRLNQGLFFSF